MRVLVTGAAGFLGRHLVPALTERGHEVFAAGHDAAYPLDLRLPELVAELFRETRPDAVVHLAAVPAPPDQPENVVHPLLNVLELAGPRPVLVVSSARVYGAGPADEGGPLRPTDLQGAAWASAEALALRRAAKMRQHVVIVRPFFVLGPALAPGSEVGRWLTRAAAGDRVIATQNLERTRDLIDVRDAVEGFFVLLQQGRAGTVYNLSTGRSLPLRVVFERLCPDAQAIPAPEVREPLSLVGEAPGLRALGWAPRHSVQATLGDVTVHRPARRR